MTTTIPENYIPIFKSGSFVDDRGKRLIGKYMLGGAAIGGSAALATSLMNYLNTLKQQGDAANDTSEDDDTLFLTLRNKNQNAPNVIKGTGTRKMASIGGGLALTGGALATLGTYSLVRQLYQKYKKKQLQSELDDSQQQFFDTVSQEGAAMKRGSEKSAIVEREGDEWLLYTKDKSRVLGRHKTPRAAYSQEYAITKSQEREAEKKAAMNPADTGKPMGMTEMLTSTPVTLTLLAALASGALAHKALDRTFPLPKHNTSTGPKRIVLKRQDTYKDSEDELGPDGEPKIASYDDLSESVQYDDGLEFLIHTVLENVKKANVSELRTIVGAAANGQLEEFTTNMLEYGYDTAINMIKGAEEHFPKTRGNQIIAVARCVKSAAVNPVVGVLAAGEYEDMAPHFMKVSAEKTTAQKELLCKIAGVLGAFGRNQVLTASDIYVDKSAACLGEHCGISPDLGQLFSDFLEHAHATNKDDDEDPDLNLMTTESESSQGSEEGTHTESQDHNGKPKIVDMTSRKKHQPIEVPVEDQIDQVLVGGGKGLS